MVVSSMWPIGPLVLSKNKISLISVTSYLLCNQKLGRKLDMDVIALVKKFRKLAHGVFLHDFMPVLKFA